MMKKNLLGMMTAIRTWGAMLLACGLVMTTMCACGDDDETTGNGVDDLAFLQQRIAAEGDLVYGKQLGTDPADILNRPVATEEEALAEFYKLLPDGVAHKGLSKQGDGTIRCRLTDKEGKQQGTVTFRPSQDETLYYCAEVAFSAEVKQATGISTVRFILYDRWPEEGNGFIKGILDSIKK